MDNVALLRQVSIFQELPEAVLADLAGRCRPKIADAGSVIVSQEEPGDALFVIGQGRVKVVLYGETGREIILSILQVGDFFGEMSLLDRQPRSANVVAIDEAHLLSLDREAFQTHLTANPSTGLAILAEMSRRLRHADEVIGNLALLDVYARVARAIRDLAQKQGEPIEGGLLVRERPTQQEMAGLIGTSRETVSRALNDFTRRGLIEMNGKQILVRWGFLRNMDEAA
ncbi:MAG: Crp/Fnr family transcriptional regulator [Deltaproteobacteria bacterium]|nr:Crp/Fnr family transcriptional regulator [Deltaproteobacteria bacterium]